MILSINRCVPVSFIAESESMIFDYERIPALLAMQLSTVYAACESKCVDLKGSDGNTWKDDAGWTCQMYQDSANQGICRGFCNLHAMHSSSQLNAE